MTYLLKSGPPMGRPASYENTKKKKLICYFIFGNGLSVVHFCTLFDYTDFGVDERIGSHGPGGNHFLAHLCFVRPFFRKTRTTVQRHLVVGTGFAMKYLHVMYHTSTIRLNDRLELYVFEKIKE